MPASHTGLHDSCFLRPATNDQVRRHAPAPDKRSWAAAAAHPTRALPNHAHVARPRHGWTGRGSPSNRGAQHSVSCGDELLWLKIAWTFIRRRNVAR